MKTTITTFFVALFLATTFLGGIAKAQNVNIPDSVFKTTLLAYGYTINSNPWVSGISKIDINGDGEIQVSEAEAYTGHIYLTGSSLENSVTDFTGLEAFINFSKFSYAIYSFTPIEVVNLDLSNFQSLEEIQVFGDISIEHLNIKNNQSLTKVGLHSTYIKDIDLSNNTSLSIISCTRNDELAGLDLTNNTSLTELYCDENLLTELDLTTNTALRLLDCDNNSLTSLDVSNNTLITNMACSHNELTELDLSQNSALKGISCYSSKLRNLDLSNNPNLEKLICFDNQLSSLNIANGNNENIELLIADNNPNLTCAQHDANFDPNTKPYNDNGTNINFYDDTGWKIPAAANWSSTPCDDRIVYIPDSVFKNTLLAYGYTITDNPWVSGISKIDINGDGEIQVSEAEAYTGHIYLTGSSLGNSVADFTGLEAFINFSKFSYAVYSFTPIEVVNLDLSNFQSLEEILVFGDISIEHLNVKNNPVLNKVYVGHSYITSVDLSNNQSLTLIEAYNNKDIEELDVSNNPSLIELICNSSQISSLDLSAGSKLTDLYLGDNKLTDLDLSNNTNLINLICGDNELTSLDVSNNQSLRRLSCSHNRLSELNLSYNSELAELDCFDNELTGLDVSNNSNLIDLLCYENPQLKTLNLANGNNSNMYVMLAHNNPNLVCIQHDADFDPSSKPYNDGGNTYNVYDDTGWKKDETASWCTTSCSPTNLDTHNFAEKSTIFPNPFDNVLNITNSDVLNAISIYDITGQKIKEFEPRSRLNLSNFNQSIYIIKLLYKNGNIELIKAIKQ